MSKVIISLPMSPVQVASSLPRVMVAMMVTAPLEVALTGHAASL